MVTVPAVRCPGLHLTTVPHQPHDGAGSAAPSCPARRQPGCGPSSRRQRSQAPAFADHQQLPAADDPASRRNGDPGATSSGESAGNGAEAQAPPSSDAAITALRAELDSLRLTVSTQAAAAQQQFTSITALERDLRGGAMTGELTSSRCNWSSLTLCIHFQATLWWCMAVRTQHRRCNDTQRNARFAGSTNGASPVAGGGWNPQIRPFDAQRAAIGDRRYLGGFDARFHSTAS